MTLTAVGGGSYLASYQLLALLFSLSLCVKTVLQVRTSTGRILKELEAPLSPLEINRVIAGLS